MANVAACDQSSKPPVTMQRDKYISNCLKTHSAILVAMQLCQQYACSSHVCVLLVAFRLAGGLAWVAFLTVGSLGEQIKTRIEVANEEAATQDVQAAVETVLPSGVRYSDVRKGGGQNPIKGYLVIVEYT